MRALCVLALLTLAACGADGAPTKPAPKPGLNINGEAAVGVVIK